MNAIKSSKGVVLALVLAFLALFVMGTALYLTLTTNDFRTTKRATYASKAFFLAESGIHKALYGLRKIPGYSGEGPLAIDGYPNEGEYHVIVSDVGLDKRVVSTGYFPHESGFIAKKSIEAVMSDQMPAGFWGNAVYAGENVSLGSNSTIGGAIKYGEGGSISPSDTPNAQELTEGFPMLNFELLRAQAQAQIKPDGQNNLYTVADIANKKPFPTSFWFDETTVPKTPNIVYVETDLALNGSVGTICGFFVVAGDVLTNTSPDPADTTINGNGTIDGCVYTLGDFKINGGGVNGLEVSGGIWAQGDVELKGKGEIEYNSTYQTSMAPFVTTTYKMNSWKETH